MSGVDIGAVLVGHAGVATSPIPDPEVIRRAVFGYDGVLVVLAPWDVNRYACGTAPGVLDHGEPGARRTRCHRSTTFPNCRRSLTRLD